MRSVTIPPHNAYNCMDDAVSRDVREHVEDEMMVEIDVLILLYQIFSPLRLTERP